MASLVVSASMLEGTCGAGYAWKTMVGDVGRPSFQSVPAGGVDVRVMSKEEGANETVYRYCAPVNPEGTGGRRGQAACAP